MKRECICGLLLAIPLTIGIASCATRYAPLTPDAMTGYTESRLDSSTWNVAFVANQSTDMALVNRYMLYHCAELTAQNGFDYFLLLDFRDSSVAPHTLVSDADPRDTTSCPDPLKASTPPLVGISSLRLSMGSHSAQATIRMMHGQYPIQNRRAYDARFMLVTMSSTIDR